MGRRGQRPRGQDLPPGAHTVQGDHDRQAAPLTESAGAGQEPRRRVPDPDGRAAGLRHRAAGQAGRGAVNGRVRLRPDRRRRLGAAPTAGHARADQHGRAGQPDPGPAGDARAAQPRCLDRAPARAGAAPGGGHRQPHPPGGAGRRPDQGTGLVRDGCAAASRPGDRRRNRCPAGQRPGRGSPAGRAAALLHAAPVRRVRLRPGARGRGGPACGAGRPLPGGGLHPR